MRVPGLWPRSVRGRLAVLSAIGALCLASATAVLLLRTLGTTITEAIDDGLTARADDIETSLRAGDLQLAQEEAFAQVVTSTGELLLSSSTIAPEQRVLTDDELALASNRETTFERSVPGLGEHGRLLARPATFDELDTVIMVGASNDSGDRAQDRLRAILFLTVPSLALLLGLAAWFVVGRALAPAERMAAEAERISLTAPGRRLPVPPRDHELAHLGTRLNAMLARLERAYEHERAFLDDASHELRTPLSILRGELELALDEPDDVDAVRGTLRSALEETDRLSAITSDLLTLARADSRSITMNREAVDLVAAVEQARDRLSTPDTGAVVEIVGDAVTVDADRRRLEQVIVNLLSNALRHAQGRVQVRITDDGDGATLQVADDGPGFAPEILPRAFERFSRAEPGRGRRHGGTGLGLAIVDALAQAHGGGATARNGPPLGGAVVEVRLPRR